MTDSENFVVQLCVQGMQAETEGRDTRARDLFLQAWEAAQDDYDACTAAHYLARHQPTPQETLHWNQECLNRDEKVGDDRVRGFYASLHANMARAHRDMGQTGGAREHFKSAAQHIGDVPAGPYQQWLPYRIAAGLRATAPAAPQQREDPVSELITAALRMLHAERRLPDEQQTALGHAITVRSAV